MDALAQVVHVEQVLAPAFVDDLQQQEALEGSHQLLAERLLSSLVELHGVGHDAFAQGVAIDRLGIQVLVVDVEGEELAESRRYGSRPAQQWTCGRDTFTCKNRASVVVSV